MSKGHLFVISGTSGVGKSTVLQQLMEQRKDLLFSVSATTRAPRPKEIDGVDYYFVTHAHFQEMIDGKAFVEYDNHMKHFYGTPKDQLEEKLTRGNVILDIEPKGAAQVRAARPDATLIFIVPPSMEELERRLRGRGDTSEEQILGRLERAKWELAQTDKYDYQVVNDDVDTCTQKILNIIANKADKKEI